MNEELINIEKKEENKRPRTKTVYEFFGRVIEKVQIKQTSGRFVGQIRYDLVVEIYDKPWIRIIQVMKNRVPEEIWEAVLKSDYYSWNWVFYCYGRGERYRLFDWKEESKAE